MDIGDVTERGASASERGGGYVWSSSPQSAANGYHLDFNYSGRIRPSNDNPRSFGFSVRCVQE